MNPLKDYLSQMSMIRRSAAGVKETSYYGTLETLFNGAGKSLKPKVRCVINLANKGAGIPDGGLFTPNQYQRSSNDLIEGQLPERGAIEVKGTGDDVDVVKDTIQVSKYLVKYGQVLVTNYRDFLLVTLDENKTPKALERYNIAEDEKAFWQKADGYAATTEIENERFVEFLKRVMLHRAPLAKPEDVAWFLASYARDARARVEMADVSALATIRKALEESLGIKFDGDKGEHFFRSSLVRTLFYGIFSAWVLWHKRHPTFSDKFQWRTAVWELKVPMISVLFTQLATPANVRQLNLEEVLDWTESVLNRVVRGEFFARFAEDHAVQYFYEPFLQAFDPELRKELGVWYTPSEIVRYMVERVDRVLREELNLPDGLADESVYVLDPACGTGAYLVEVLKRINQTLEEKGEDATRGQKLKRAVMSRVFGFEILPAPFVVSHLQISLLLEQLGVGFRDDKKERAGVYLTNSLTGWDEHPKKHLPYPEFEQERDAADKIKKESRILVILGNPPYNAFAGVAQTEEESVQIDVYKKGLVKEWGIKKFNLDDLYVRFFRLAERKIAEQTGQGIVCYISNFSYLSDPSFVVMRKKFLSEFDRVWIDNLNGDSRETGKTTPLGKPDPSIFSTEQTKTGIRVGTSIGLFVRRPDHVDGGMAEVGYREFWGTRKREELLESIGIESLKGDFFDELDAIDKRKTTESKTDEETATPELRNRFSIRPSDISAAYQSWPSLSELSLTFFAGLSEDRRKALISTDQNVLRSRIEKYYDKSVSWEDLESLNTYLTRDIVDFDAKKARKNLLESEAYDPSQLQRYTMRPFDTQWCYYTTAKPIWRRPRPEYWKSYLAGAEAIVTRFKCGKVPEGVPMFLATSLCDYHAMPPNSSVIPFQLRIVDNTSKDENQTNLFGKGDDLTKANLSELAINYLRNLGFDQIDDDAETVSLIWYHALAIGYSSEYLTENEDGVRQDFPRIPLPANHDDLIASAELGRRVAALLDTEREVAGVTAGSVRPELRSVGVAAHIDGKQFHDEDFKVTAGWGHGGKDGVTMPGKGKVVHREYTEREREVMAGLIFTAKNPVATAPGSDPDHTLDIYLNDHAYWRNVPELVWNYYIGGYQVIKKWLSYREFSLLGRPLTIDEVTEVTNMTRRIAALILMQAELNDNYYRVKANTYVPT